ncbi:protein GrpE [Alphaproteobacteria bacterium]|nr:protein GrpE [Alphaproteobacteria bacterium]GHS97197.1 protein GrpE [Alphaproteobacteria bacterium]
MSKNTQKNQKLFENASETPEEVQDGAPAKEESKDFSPISALNEELAEAKNQYLRALAEIENTRRRAEKDREEAAKFGAAALARDIITFVDNLERALKCGPKGEEGGDVASFVQGIAMISKDILAALARHGVQKLESDGQPFDPALHQAVSEVASPDQKPGLVCETLQAGYTLNGRLLRAATVVVTK